METYPVSATLSIPSSRVFLVVVRCFSHQLFNFGSKNPILVIVGRGTIGITINNWSQCLCMYTSCYFVFLVDDSRKNGTMYCSEFINLTTILSEVKMLKIS